MTATTLLDAMAAAGLEYRGEIIPDGKLHRIKVNGDRNPNSWYVFHDDGLQAGSFGCWKRGFSESWCSKGTENLTEAERAERDRKWQQQTVERENDRRRLNDEAQAMAQKIIDTAAPANADHPYLLRKRVKAHPGVMVGPWPQRQKDNCLLIPLRAASGTLATVQAIYRDKPADGRDKDFLKGAPKKGAFFTIGDVGTAKTIIVAEGYATAATIYEATGHASVMAVDAGNLLPVAEALRALYPDTRIIIAADNDRATEGNPGLTEATAAAKAIGLLAVPQFADDEAGTDFNDLAALHGMGAVREALLNASKPTDEPGAAESLDLDPYRGTDEANAALFLSLHGADIRYCPPWDKWLLWTGSHWRIDDLMDVARLAGDMPRELYRKAGESIDTARRRTIAGLARALESRRKQSDLLAAARCRVVVSHTDLDKGRFLLNASNGTIDLSAGTLREHRRADLLTHDTEISYRPDTAAPLWERFLFEIFAGDTDLIRFVQHAVGYSLTGDVREQVLFICHGNGSNGKSVFLNIVRKLLGKLALQAAPDLLMADRHRRHPTEQADLFGKRLVVCQETAEGRRFNESLVKQLTGGDAITARRMFEDNWTFEPTHKLWLATNHRPEIRGTDHAIWRRIRLIPFNVQFSDDGDHRKDPDMEAKLAAELPRIMAWGVRGCLDWQREGLRAPEAVKTATASYQQEQDVLAAWLADCCIVKRTADAKAADLYASYADWCQQSGEHPEPQRRWGMRLTERGFQRQKRMAGHFWLGIGLLSMTHMTQDTPEKAKVLAPLNLAGKSAKSGSYGAYGSCPPVDSDAETLAFELATLAGLDVARMLAGDLTEADWPRITSAAVLLSERQPDRKADLAMMIEAIDSAYTRMTP